jgi:hypothetical protein
MPLQQRTSQGSGDFFGQHRFAGARLPFDQQRMLQGQGRIDGQFQVVGSDVRIGALKANGASGERGLSLGYSSN